MDQTILYILIIFTVSFALTVIALIDIIKKDFGSVKTKFLWHFVAIVPLLGWLIYFIFGAKKGKKTKQE